MLDQKTKSRIFEDAKAYARRHGMKEIGYYMINYEAGATAEAERAAGLVVILSSAINELDDLFNPNLNKEEVARKITKLERSLRDALTKYNQSK